MKRPAEITPNALKILSTYNKDGDDENGLSVLNDKIRRYRDEPESSNSNQNPPQFNDSVSKTADNYVLQQILEYSQRSPPRNVEVEEEGIQKCIDDVHVRSFFQFFFV